MTSPINFGLNRVTVSAFLGTPIQDIKVARMFIVARMERGPVNSAIICQDDQEFTRTFGQGGTAEYDNNVRAVRDYFKEVGNLSDVVVLRLYQGDVDAGKSIEPTGNAVPVLRVRAANPGPWGDNLQRNVYQTSQGVYTLTVREMVGGSILNQRTVRGLEATAEGVEKANRVLSGLAELTHNPDGTVDFLSLAVDAGTPTWVQLAGGVASGNITVSTLAGQINPATQERSGLQVLNLSSLGGGVLVAPNLTGTTQRETIMTFAQETGRMHVQAPSANLLPPDALSERDALSTLTGASYGLYAYPNPREIRDNVVRHYSALGALAGRMVRAVMEQPGKVTAPGGVLLSMRDVQRAPNGKDPLVHDQNLNALVDAGINCLYASGSSVTWQGNSLLAPDPMTPHTDQVHERLLLCALIYDIGPGLAQFSNSTLDARGFLTSRIVSYLRDKLMRYYESGCLYGASPDEAFSIKINAVLAAQTAEKKGRLEVKVNVKTSPVLQGVDVALFHVPINEKV